MDNIWLNLLSIAIAVVLALIGYSQTFGAKKERAKAANTELENLLSRQIVNESYQPSIDDITHLINGKARERQVKPRDLFSEYQLLENVYSKIVESHFLTQDRREEIIQRISPILVIEEQNFDEGISVASLKETEKKTNLRSIQLLLSGFIVSLFSALIVYIIYGGIQSTPSTSNFLITLSVSFISIMLIFFFLRFRESQSDPSPIPNTEAGLIFEKEVVKSLQTLKIKVISPPIGHDMNYDYQVELPNGKKILVEIKTVFRHFRTDLIQRLDNAVKAQEAVAGIIIVKDPVNISPSIFQGTAVRIMSLPEFKSFIKHKD